MNKVKAYLTLFRISNLPTILSNVLVGITLSRVYTHSFTLWQVFFSCAAFYTAGMVFNDIFDYRWDKKHRPERPLVVGYISKIHALVTGISLIVFALICLIIVHLSAFWSGLVLLFFIMLYNLRHKENPASPVIMGLCRAMVYIIALIAFAPGAKISIVWIPATLLMCYLVGLTHIASHEHQRKKISQSSALLLYLPVVYAIYSQTHSFNYTTLCLLILNVLWVSYCLYSIFKGKIANGITQLIAGIALVDGLFISIYGKNSLFLSACLSCWLLTLFFQKYIRAT